MTQFKLSRTAKADLKNIAQHTERQWGRAQRNHYILQLDQGFHLLADNPELGHCCDEISPGYRQYLVGSHVICYRLGSGEIPEIIRILHKRMLPKM